MENQRRSSEIFPGLSSLVLTSAVLIHQEQSCTSELFKVIQDAVSLILLYRTMLLFRATSSNTIYHVGCAIDLHSIINSGLIPGGQKFEQQTDSILSTCGSQGQKNKDPDTTDLNEPWSCTRHA